ncbi:heme peroxidase [Rhodococcus hoagii]|nr:heme peroxidase [Prescottella equi]MBM4665765.1 heme peroxidase [Prescottella equi]NKV86994.1 heme peroxidase [Prescottella equi]
MSVSQQQVQTVAAACRSRLGDPSGWVAPDQYRRSLALCIIESVQAAGSRYADAGTVIDRYMAYRRTHTPGPVDDGARELLRTFEEAGSSDQWAGKIGNYKRRYSDGAAPLRAAEIQRTAERLYTLRIDSVGDLLDATRDERARTDLHDAWVECSGAHDDTTWEHLLLLAGAPHAQHTGAIDEFVDSALADGPGLADASEADEPSVPPTEILAAAADTLGVAPPALEHAVRRWKCVHAHACDTVA